MRLLVITNKDTHSEYDSVYGMCENLHQPNQGVQVFITSINYASPQFSGHTDILLYQEYSPLFNYSRRHEFFEETACVKGAFKDFDVIFFRIDRAPQKPEAIFDFFKSVEKFAPNAQYINSPKGLWETRSKAYLTNFLDICPEFHIVESLQEAFNKFNGAFVFKPLDGYAGHGIIRVNSKHSVADEAGVYEGTEAEKFLNSIPANYFPVMAMRFLKNVSKGDKRIVVAAGKTLGAVLRVPKKDSWLANLAQGASSHPCELTNEEEEIIKRIDPILRQSGILLYGIDTLVDDDGKRVLSEINSANVGGLLQIQKAGKQSVFKEMAIHLLDTLR